MTHSPAAPVRKAVIPAAGFGTRLFPATKAVKKELFPVIDRHGQAKPLIQAIVEEAISGGIESVGIVVQPDDRPLFDAFFKQSPQGAYRDKLLPKYETELEALLALGDRVTLLTQDSPEGFGHAVWCAKDWVGNEPFLLLLGDHVYCSDTTVSCARQVINVFEQVGVSVVGIEPAWLEQISHRGGVAGEWQAHQPILRLTQLCEKPSVEYARQQLQTPGLPPNQCFAIFGLYVLQPEIFYHLEDHIQRNVRQHNEFQLTSALEELRQANGMVGYPVQGRSFDTGRPDSYRQALIEFGRALDKR